MVLHQVKEIGAVTQKEINYECKTVAYISLALTILGCSYTAGSIQLFKITGTLKAENIQLNKNYTLDMLEIDCKEVTVTFKDNKINLPRVVTIKCQDKIKVRCLMKREALLFLLILKKGITCFTLAAVTQETV